MTLEEKLELFRSKNDPDEELPTVGQKQLSSKFKWALNKNSNASSMLSEAAKSPRSGSKRATHQKFVNPGSLPRASMTASSRWRRA